jgi:hypothetical protein
MLATGFWSRALSAIGGVNLKHFKRKQKHIWNHSVFWEVRIAPLWGRWGESSSLALLLSFSLLAHFGVLLGEGRTEKQKGRRSKIRELFSSL